MQHRYLPVYDRHLPVSLIDPSLRLKHMHMVESVFCLVGAVIIHLQPMSSTSMPLFDSLSRILYLLGEIEDAMTVEINVVNAIAVFSNMLLKL